MNYKDELEKKICLALAEMYGYETTPILYTKDKYREGFHVRNGKYIIMIEQGKTKFANEDYFLHRYTPDLLIMIGLFFKEE